MFGILSYAEKHYLQNSQLFRTTFDKWRQILDNGLPLLLHTVTESGGTGDNISTNHPKLMINRKLMNPSMLCDICTKDKVRFTKVADMLAQISGMLRIPHITDGDVRLRFSVSTMYTLLCDRIHLLDQFNAFLTQFKADLALVNEKFASNGYRIKYKGDYNVDYNQQEKPDESDWNCQLESIQDVDHQN